jgi:Protein of unknown function (DUF998)
MRKLFLAAGILYNSWPLGYVLDYRTARQGLASDLEQVGHPYNWVFIAADILTAVCIIAAALILIKRAGPKPKTTIAIITGLMMFGVFTAVSSLLPSHCAIAVLRCGAPQGHGIGLDAATSSVAALGLLISLVSLTIAGALHTLQSRLVGLVLLTWSISGLVFAGLAVTNRDALFAQDILMLMSGLALIIIGLTIGPATKRST